MVETVLCGVSFVHLAMCYRYIGPLVLASYVLPCYRCIEPLVLSNLPADGFHLFAKINAISWSIGPTNRYPKSLLYCNLTPVVKFEYGCAEFQRWYVPVTLNPALALYHYSIGGRMYMAWSVGTQAEVICSKATPIHEVEQPRENLGLIRCN